MKSRQRLLFIFVLPVLIVTGLGATAVFSDKFFDVARGIDLFTRVYKEVAFTYVDEINPIEFMRAGIRGMLGTVDPYTVFLDERKQEDMDLLTNGKYGGIGVSIGVRDGKVTLVEILDGYSAQKQGLQAGDIILKVDGVELNEKNFDDISSMVKGEPGTFVKLAIQREGEKDTLHFELLREEIRVKSVTWSGFYPENSSVGYIKLTQFTRSSSEEVKNAILDLKKKRSLTGLIFDVRNNPGGLLDVAVDICNRFLPKGSLIVSTRGRDSSNAKQYFAAQDPILRDVPVVVLVNENSASASEIFAGAMQDHDRSVIMGMKTFGKGLVQTIAPLSYNTSLKITTAKYYTPSGRCIQKINYSKDNKVIARADSLLKSSYYTDNKRTVYSSGGITPDTLVDDGEIPGVIRDLLARGWFFKYVNHLTGTVGKDKLTAMKPEALVARFQEYLKKENYAFQSDIDKKFDEVLALTKKDKQYSHLTQKFLDLQSALQKTSSFEVKEYKSEIVEELMIEVQARLRGPEGRVIQALAYDRQYQAALDVIANVQQYKHLLSSK